MKTRFTKDERREIIMDMIDYLRECENGLEITTSMLLSELGYADDMDLSELMDFHNALFREAKHFGIVLDMSKHDGLIEGFPCYLDYVVHNEYAVGVKCPYCGSRHTARIQYGMPLMDEQMQRLLDDKIIVLGGCLMSDRNPDYHCNDCGRRFWFFDCAEEEE